MQKKHQKVAAESISYEEAKKLALANPLLRKEVRIGDIKLVDERRILLKGHEVLLSENAFSSLVKRLGVPQAFQNRIGNLLGPQAKLNMLNAVRSALSGQENKRLQFIGNPAEKQIVGVTETTNMLSAKSFFELVETCIDKYKLDIQACSVDRFGTTSIQTSTKFAANIKGLPKDHADDEEYNPGLSFRNSIFSGTELNPYTFRMVCSNGMIAPDGRDILRIEGFDSEDLRHFYNRLDLLGKNNFISSKYNEQVVKAASTYASLGELQFLANAMMNCSGASHKTINRFVPYYECADKFRAMRINVETLDKQQLANAKTNVRLWDAINGTTDFATHKYEGVDMSSSDRARLQHSAGAILNKKTFDTASLMPSLV
jgi:hypothetical protein